MASKSKETRIKITLACQECKQRNYMTSKNKQRIQTVLKFKNTVHSARSIQYTRKQSNLNPGGYHG